MQFTTTSLKGWGADARLEERPGVPKEAKPPHPSGSPPYVEPPAQTDGSPSVQSATRPETPVYSTAIPTRGLSGVLRRKAYRMKEYKARRMLLLVLADRIDVIEHNPGLRLLAAGIAAAGVAAIVMNAIIDD